MLHIVYDQLFYVPNRSAERILINQFFQWPGTLSKVFQIYHMQNMLEKLIQEWKGRCHQFLYQLYSDRVVLDLPNGYAMPDMPLLHAQERVGLVRGGL